MLTGDEVCWMLTIKGDPHLLVAGLPGMGKTTCLRMLIDRIKQTNRFRAFYCSEGLKKPLPVVLQP